MPVKKTETVKKSVKKAPKKEGLTVDVVDVTGKVVETMQLPKDIFGSEVNKALLAQAVRVYRMNQRAGSASTKTRGEVTGSTRKIYRQKGTGRARHGAARAPIFVHGGIAHGPKPIDFSRSLSKNMKRQALFSALSLALQHKGLTVIAGLERLKPKTKAMAQTLEKLDLFKENKKNALLFVEPKGAEVLHRAIRNISGVTTMQVTQLNAYDIMRHKHLLFPKESVVMLEEQYKKEEK